MRPALLRLATVATLVATGCSPDPVRPPTPDRKLSTVTAQSPVEADGVAASVVTITVRDADGATLSGVSVALSSSSTADVFAQPAATGADGVTTGRVSSTQAGTSIITAKADGVTLLEVASVEFVEKCVEGWTR